MARALARKTRQTLESRVLGTITLIMIVAGTLASVGWGGHLISIWSLQETRHITTAGTITKVERTSAIDGVSATQYTTVTASSGKQVTLPLPASVWEISERVPLVWYERTDGSDYLANHPLVSTTSHANDRTEGIWLSSLAALVLITGIVLEIVNRRFRKQASRR